jgi:hypothetical protein
MGGMAHREIRYQGTDLIHLAQDGVQWQAVVNTVMNYRNSIKSGNCLTNLAL